MMLRCRVCAGLFSDDNRFWWHIEPLGTCPVAVVWDDFAEFVPRQPRLI